MIRNMTGILTACALAAMLQSVSADDQVERIIDHGADGHIAFYTVYCKDGQRGHVQVNSKSRRTCAGNSEHKSRCRKAWTIREAAAKACR